MNAQPEIYPCIWFDRNGREAAEFYCRVFPGGEMREDNGMVQRFRIMDTPFMLLNGGPQFRPNGAISYFVYTGDRAITERIFAALAEGGTVAMPPGKYPWADHYAWVEDRFGVNWQLDSDPIRSSQKILPTLLFTPPDDARVREARNHYAFIFSDHHLLMEMPPASNEPLLFCQFRLGSLLFNAMRSMEAMDFQFGPGNSFVINCPDQATIDHYWHKLGAGGVFERCGWLRDRFGVSWQVVPEILPGLMQDPERGGRVMEALLGMDRIVIETLLNA